MTTTSVLFTDGGIQGEGWGSSQGDTKWGGSGGELAMEESDLIG